MNNPANTHFTKADLEAVLERLRRGENLPAASERAAKIGHFEWNRERDCLANCAEEYARIFGLTVQEAVVTQTSWEKLLERVHPDDRARYEKACQAASARGHLEIEYRILLDDGEVRHLHETSVYLTRATTPGKGDFGLVQDISRRVQRRSELRRHSELADRTENLFDIGHYVYDEEQERYLYISEGFARIHATTVENYMFHAQSFDDDLQQVLEVDRERVSQAYRHYIETGEKLEIEYRIAHPDGEQRWLRELNEARSMRHGRVSHTLGVLQDITRQKEVEIELRYKDNLAVQAEIITDIGHFVYDEIDDRYIFASPGLARIYGVDVDYLVHTLQSTDDDLLFVHEDDRDMVAEAYREQAEADETGYDDWELEYRMVRPDGEVRWVREIGKTHVVEPGLNEQTIGVMIDITAQKKAEQEIRQARDNLEQQVVDRTRELAETVAQLETEVAERKKLAAELQFVADHDALTGLPGLRLGRDRVQQALTAARRSQQLVVVMFLDLDGFKKINDNHGHDAGDQVLQVVAGRIKSELREQDTVARIGGDEFLVLLADMPDTGIAERIAASIIDNVGKKIVLATTEVEVGVSIGIALYSKNGNNVDELITAADRAMYAVKSRGKNDYGFAGLKSGREIIAPVKRRGNKTR